MPKMGGVGRHALAAALLFLGIRSAAAADDVFRGTVSPELTPDRATIAVICNDAAPPPDLPVPAGARVSAASFDVLTQTARWQIRVLLIEPRDGRRPFVFVDEDRNGTLSVHERFSFSHTRRRSIRGTLRIGLASVPGAPFERIPIELALPDKDLAPEVSRDRDRVCLLQS